MAEFEFVGAVAVVTGGAGGIGRALGRRLAAEGCHVALVDRAAPAALEAAAELTAETSASVEVVGLAADVGDRASVHAMVAEVEQRLGPVDIYCSNAGIAAGFGLGDDEDWEASWRVHAMAHVHAARIVLPGMTERGRGAVVITASAAGLLMMMQSAPYTVTKHASVAVAEWLAVHHGGAGVQFHCVCPQGVRTPMVTAGGPAEVAELEAAGALIEPDRVADAVIDAIRSDRFLVLPHPEVHDYEQRKVADRDRWLGAMRRALSRVSG